MAIRKTTTTKNTTGATKDDQSAGSDFMIQEYRRLTSQLLYTKKVGQQRTQFWMTIVSAVGGLLALLYQLGGNTESFYAIAIIAGLAVFVLGIIVFIRVVHRTITIVEYLRALGKIKMYFVDRDKNISQYFFYRPGDDYPRLTYSFDFKLTGSSLHMLVVVINSFILAGMVAFIPRVIFGDWSFLGYQLIIAAAVFVLSFVIHESFTMKQFRLAKKLYKDHIDFPTED